MLAAEQELPGPLALDEAAVYFAHARGIAAVPKAGGEVTELAPDTRGVTALAVNQGALYWVEAGTPPAFEDGGLFTLPLGAEPGAAKVMLAAIPGAASGVALDAGHVYVTAQGTGGSDLATHARNLSYPWGIAVDGMNVYFSLAWNGGPATGALVRGPKGP